MRNVSKKDVLNNTPNEILLLEEKLKKQLGFKRKWLDDNSGY